MLTYIVVEVKGDVRLSSVILFLRHALFLYQKLTGSQIGLDCLVNELLGSSCFYLSEPELQMCMPCMVSIWFFSRTTMEGKAWQQEC